MPAGSRRYSGARARTQCWWNIRDQSPYTSLCYLSQSKGVLDEKAFCCVANRVGVAALAILVARVEAQAVPALENIKSQEELEKAITTLDAGALRFV